ncbi:helix-turn-helix domain-containing protein [Spirosoma validum]|uniref:Helix-turn-helix transcriptional regulator n=1 Tax=Spirosoma validum TaxID=2771355 RepID=A0A927AZG8_9BACT|nr:helix-turn-helix transcriptional regulator [Spirosoma validum]MBD2752624.1 helix-turn-helix transcriptional regulator [Spirosoma validum]
MSDIAEQVGELIKQTRKEKGLTQKELGEKIGVSESMINKYESGKQNPTIATLSKIIEALGVRLKISVEKR